MAYTPVDSTYVSQFVPLPTDVLQNYVTRVDQARQQEDTGLDRLAEVQAAVGATTLDSDREYLQSILGQNETTLNELAELPAAVRARRVRQLARNAGTNLAPLQQRHAFYNQAAQSEVLNQYAPEDRAEALAMLRERMGTIDPERVATGNYMPGEGIGSDFARYVDVDANLASLVERSRPEQFQAAAMEAGIDINTISSSDGYSEEMVRQVARHRLTTGETGAWLRQQARFEARRSGVDEGTAFESLIKNYEDNAVRMYSRTVVTNNFSNAPSDGAGGGGGGGSDDGPDDGVGFVRNGTFNWGQTREGASISVADWNASHPVAVPSGLSASTARLIANNTTYAGDGRTYTAIIRSELAKEAQGALRGNAGGMNAFGEGAASRLGGIGTGYRSSHPLIRDLRSRGELDQAMAYTQGISDRDGAYQTAVRRGTSNPVANNSLMFQITEPRSATALQDMVRMAFNNPGGSDIRPLQGGTVQAQLTETDDFNGWVPEGSPFITTPGPDGIPRVYITMGNGETGSNKETRDFLVGFPDANIARRTGRDILGSTRPGSGDHAIGALLAVQGRGNQGPMGFIANLRPQTGRQLGFFRVPGFPTRGATRVMVARGTGDNYYLTVGDGTTRRTAITREQLFTRLAEIATELNLVQTD